MTRPLDERIATRLRFRGKRRTRIDLRDLQGNVVRGYAAFGYFFARYVFFRFPDAAAGRAALTELLPLVTASHPWRQGATEGPDARPPATTNIAFTFAGLEALGLPQASLHSFPVDFTMGMRARGAILGDEGSSGPEHWDPIWQSPDPVHMLVSINALDPDALAARYEEIEGICGRHGSSPVAGHGPDGDAPFQAGHALFENGVPSGKEHFGYRDGISNPYFEGAGLNDANVIGGGKPNGGDATSRSGWDPLEAGEFVLGHVDEAGQYPRAPKPGKLGHNGTFLVYRKLHQNTGSFDTYLEEEAKRFPGDLELLAAKFAGRWRNGAPLALFPTEAEATDFATRLGKASAKARSGGPAAEYLALRRKLVAFTYDEDPDGARCPFASHARRVNPRGALNFGEADAFETPAALTNRRRILRRGLPYGDSVEDRSDDGDHGIVFMALCASIDRQFEFLQQQWIDYGNDFRLASDRDPIVGANNDATGAPRGRMLVEADPEGDAPPHFCLNIPRFVDVRGGDYFFVPSITALQMIASGTVDPT